MRKSIKRAAKAIVSNVPAIIEPVTPAETGALESVIPADLANGVTLDNATGDVIPTEALSTEQPETNSPAVEATPDQRQARAERIAADRKAVRALYSAFEAQRASVPVKPLSAFKLASTTAHPIARNVSPRQCAALAVAFAAAGKKLATGAKAPRVFEFDGKPVAIENGVLRDAISSGLCTVTGETPEAEIIVLSKTAAKAIAGQLGSKLLTEAGII